MKAIKQWIPFTDARRERLYNQSLAKLASDADGLCLLEWPDKQMTMHKAAWNSEINGWELDNGKRVFPRGKGGDPKQYNGVPVIQAHSEEAGVVSTEAAITAGAMEDGQVMPVDPEGRPVDGAESGAVSMDDMPDEPGEAVADGGQQVADYVPDYPVKGLEWDAVEYSLAEAVLYDPFPVREDDARQAAEWAELSGQDQSQVLRYVAYGAAGAFAIVLGFIIIIWLLGQIGGGDTGITLSIAPVSAAAAAAVTAAPAHRLPTRDGVLQRVRSAASHALYVPGARWFGAAALGLDAVTQYVRGRLRGSDNRGESE